MTAKVAPRFTSELSFLPVAAATAPQFIQDREHAAALPPSEKRDHFPAGKELEHCQSNSEEAEVISH